MFEFNVSSDIHAIFDAGSGHLHLTATDGPTEICRVWCDSQLVGEVTAAALAEGVLLSMVHQAVAPQIVRLDWVGGGSRFGRVWQRSASLAPLASAHLWIGPLMPSQRMLFVLADAARPPSADKLSQLAGLAGTGIDGFTLVLIGKQAGVAALRWPVAHAVRRQIVLDCDPDDAREAAWRIDQIVRQVPGAFCVALDRCSAAVAAQVTLLPVISTPWTRRVCAPRNGVLELSVARMGRDALPDMEVCAAGLRVTFDRHNRRVAAGVRAFLRHWYTPPVAAEEQSALPGLLDRVAERPGAAPVRLLYDDSPEQNRALQSIVWKGALVALRGWLVGHSRFGQPVHGFDPRGFEGCCTVYAGSDPDLDSLFAAYATRQGGDYLSRFRNVVARSSLEPRQNSEQGQS